MTDTYSNTADPGGGGETTVTPDIVVTDRDLFESAVQDPAPQQRTDEQRQQPPQQQPPQRQQPPQQRQQPPQQQLRPGEQPRNERGQFQSPQQQPQPQQQRPQQQPPQGGAAAPQEQHRVPLRELLDERERRYRLQAEADQMRQAWADLHRQAEAHRQQQAPQSIYDDPNAYLQHHVMQPLRNEGHMAMLQIKDGLSREMANAQFGEQAVNEALQAIASIRQSPQGDFIFRQIMSSGHPYGHLVRWFHHARMQQQIGPDPNAWLQRQREAWMNDPQVRAEVMRRSQQQQQQPQQRQRGAPPNVQLPPSLSSLPASSGRADQGGDMSDASLFAFATR